jgi:putative heme iron utilization protein
MTGIDVDGIDIAAGDESRRVFFPSPLKDAQDMRMALVEMAKEARQALASQI